jgi:Protein of unknown function (DUF3455)
MPALARSRSSRLVLTGMAVVTLAAGVVATQAAAQPSRVEGGAQALAATTHPGPGGPGGPGGPRPGPGGPGPGGPGPGGPGGPGPLPPAPAAITPPAGSRPIGSAVVVAGTQTYTCAAGSFAGASVPEAQLAGSVGRIHHFAGPTWQSTRDQSLVTATKTAGVDVSGSIPQLLLTVNSHSGTGVMSRVAYIQRLRTSGGAAPAGACTDGEKKAVPYRATYVFWSAA